MGTGISTCCEYKDKHNNEIISGMSDTVTDHTSPKTESKCSETKEAILFNSQSKYLKMIPAESKAESFDLNCPNEILETFNSPEG